MITLTHKKHPHLPFKVGCKVRAIENSRWYKIGAIGIVKNIIKFDGSKDSLIVQFIAGNFDPACNWFGPKSDFVVIE